ncbi:dickkopf-related protein 2-like [Nelusetta ayraudi]|uniref:dickkopf-related protein 2-like n=1 Tax=Nelusetta ayraudi TaxID=303726 RepID=UPI003F71777C
MRRHPAAAVCLAMLLVASCEGGEARVRLNAIRTVILREGHMLPANRSLWGPSLDLTLYQCMSDLECREGSYCHTPAKGPAHSRCQTCRRRNRRCHRDGMCCPGSRCSHNACVAEVDSFVSQRIPESDGEFSPLIRKKGWKKRRMTTKEPTGQVGDPCLRSLDCSEGLCCARHFWTHICKPVLREGQVCTRHRRKRNHGLELFQRCPCDDGLSCQKLQEPRPGPSSKSTPALSEVEMPQLAAASSPSRHSSPHTSLLSTPKSLSAVAKTRLHVCQKN